jgi:hypothetical protein
VIRRTKIEKLQRRVDLLTAQNLAAEGRHDEARTLFAKHGIGYCQFVEAVN